MTGVAKLLLEHMRDTCKDLGLVAIWIELEKCNWLDRYECMQYESEAQEVRDSFEHMHNVPPNDPHSYWVHSRENVMAAAGVMRFFGYDFEADWLLARSRFCTDNQRRLASEPVQYLAWDHGR
jgi:hypothetical protein